MFSSLKYQEEGKVAFLEFDHGKANEMGSQQLAEFEALCGRLESGAVVALVSYSRRVTSKGAPIFIAGANVTERVGWEDDRIKAHVRWQRQVLNRLRHAPVFHVAVVHGVALGWGTEFLITCDYRIATPGARMGLPETGLGILPGAGGTSELWSMIGLSQTLRLGMTGQQIDAAEALRIGLVQEVQADLETGLAKARELVGMVERRSPTAVAAFKAATLSVVGREASERQTIEALAYEHCVDSGEAAIGRANFDAILKGGRPEWGGMKRWMP